MMSDYSISYSTGWYSVSPGFAWWHRTIPDVDTVKQGKETKRRRPNKKENVICGGFFGWNFFDLVAKVCTFGEANCLFLKWQNAY